MTIWSISYTKKKALYIRINRFFCCETGIELNRLRWHINDELQSPLVVCIFFTILILYYAFPLTYHLFIYCILIIYNHSTNYNQQECFINDTYLSFKSTLLIIFSIQYFFGYILNRTTNIRWVEYMHQFRSVEKHVFSFSVQLVKEIELLKYLAKITVKLNF